MFKQTSPPHGDAASVETKSGSDLFSTDITLADLDGVPAGVLKTLPAGASHI